MIKLGVNIDHVATLRQARGTQYPSPVQAALMAEGAGAAALAGALQIRRRLAGKRVGLVLSGGNVDADVFGQVLLHPPPPAP